MRIPGSVATFVTCSYTLWSIARTSGSLANSTPGTRIFPRGSIRHSNSELRVSSERSTILLLSHVHHALGHPRPPLVHHLETGPGGALHLYRGLVPLHFNGLAEGHGAQAAPFECHLVAREEHRARRHLEDESVQPVVEQALGVAGLAPDRHRHRLADLCRVGHDGGERTACVGEGLT